MHMMLDLETLSLDNRAVVFQIGVVVFDLTGLMPVKMKFHLDILPQIMKGRIVDSDTQRWWMEQPVEPWMRWPKEVMAVHTVIGDINALFENGDISHVWANSPSFDCVILRTLAADFNMKLAWDFRQDMDLRTLKSMNSIARLEPCDPFETTHDALKDCEDQVRKVVYYWNNIIGAENQAPLS